MHMLPNQILATMKIQNSHIVMSSRWKLRLHNKTLAELFIVSPNGRGLYASDAVLHLAAKCAPMHISGLVCIFR